MSDSQSKILTSILPPEICNNAIDDDGDGLIDCADSDCRPLVTHSIIDCQATNADINLTVTNPNTPTSYRWSDMVEEAHWQFNNNTNDGTANAHHQTSLTGTAAYDAVDKIEGSHAFNFNGSTFIRYGIDGGFLETAYSARTYSMWIKPANLTGIKILFEQGGSTDGMAARLNANVLTAAYRTAGVQRTTGTLTFPNDGAWHHVAVVFNSGTLTCYLDGVASTSATSAATSIPANANNDAIGARNSTDAFASSASNFYSGRMDDVRLFYSALPAQRIADLARNDGDRLNLGAGTYTVTVTSSTGCTATRAITMTIP
ncbi:MAG: LamG domain-containing protein, partial [Saprospiraceae bacterium]|nr:LamG domain-containing protein [Saprospiraceae bacterium]